MVSPSITLTASTFISDSVIVRKRRSLTINSHPYISPCLALLRFRRILAAIALYRPEWMTSYFISIKNVSTFINDSNIVRRNAAEGARSLFASYPAYTCQSMLS